MKSYIQGLITGGVLVFALFVLMGANNSGEIGRYAISTAAKDGKIYQTIFDTKIGKVTKRGIKKDNKFDY
jgi:hypothetical protein|tara:strand:+ start:198 stop:407 length:210 start_codon:yes stop_codon:yes gene_type:complete